MTSNAETAARRLRELMDVSTSRPGHHPVSENQVAEALRHDYGLVGTLTPVATEKDDSFRFDTEEGRRFLVKVSAADETPDIIDLQTSAMTWLEQHASDLPVQRMHRTIGGSPFIPLGDAGSTRSLRVLEWIHGIPWADQHPCSATALGAIGALHASVGNGLRGYTHPAATRDMVWDVKNLPALRPLLAHVDEPSRRRAAESLVDRFESDVTPQLPTLEQRVRHADVSPFNVIMRADGVPAVAGLIDFGDVVLTTAVTDLSVPMANLLSADSENPWHSALAYLRSYCAVDPLPADEIALLTWAAPGRLLMRILITEGRARDWPEREEYLRQHAKRDWHNLEATLEAPEPHLAMEETE